MEIIHRKGLVHSNADALSRPVCVCRQELDEGFMTLELYENEGFLTYLKYKKHVSGLTKSKVKKIEQVAKNYEIDENDQLIYTHNNKRRIVPKPAERRKIVEEKHAMGHFQVEATKNRVAVEYFWPKLEELVVEVIRNCEACKRNHLEAPLQHNAKAIKVTGVLDKSGMDLTFGLPETSDGYRGLITMIDYLTKFVWAFPIRTKTKGEISDIVWNFICQYGPPKEILTDNGGEFNNKLMTDLLGRLNVKHQCSASYSPRTSGLIERFNYLFVESLRKVIDDEEGDWTDYVPIVLLTFRTKVHTTLLFGREMNNFDKWDSEGEDCLECNIMCRM